MPILNVFFQPILSESTQVAIVAVLALMLLDIVFGVANACVTGTFSSKVMRAGISHKAGSLGLLVVADIVDGAMLGGLDLGLGIQSPVLLVSCVYLIVMELGSVMETLCKLNPELAESPIFKVLDSVKADESDE